MSQPIVDITNIVKFAFDGSFLRMLRLLANDPYEFDTMPDGVGIISIGNVIYILSFLHDL